jgi:hypothetical protein
MEWSAILRRMSERWPLVGGYAAAAVGAQTVYRLTVALTDQPAWQTAMLLFWLTVFTSAWWNIWRLLSRDGT